MAGRSGYSRARPPASRSPHQTIWRSPRRYWPCGLDHWADEEDPPPRPSYMSADLPALPRVGLGLDVHALEDGRRLVLGGIEIPHKAGLAGHSDGDALVH